ncbi:hypothetical protein FF1_023196 [Malus domestica]
MMFLRLRRPMKRKKLQMKEKPLHIQIVCTPRTCSTWSWSSAAPRSDSPDYPETLPASLPTAPTRPLSCGTFNFDSLARVVDLSVGDKLVIITTELFMDVTSASHVKRIVGDPEDQVGESALILKGPQGRINRDVWGPLNRTIIVLLS